MDRFRVFTFLWCAGILFHQLFQGRFLQLDATAPLTVAALWSILRPGSLGRFLVLAAVQLCTVALELPLVVNHWLLMGVSCLGLLLGLGPAWLAERRGAPTDEESRLRALGSVRAQIVIVYLYATFHKLNTSFLDPSLSCGADHYRRLMGSVPLLPDAPWAMWCAVVGTLAIEAALPLLLVVRRTRPAAFVLAWAFHGALGWNGFWDFSSVATPYYAAFLPAWFLVAFAQVRERHGWLARLCDLASRTAAKPAAFPVALVILVVSIALPDLLGEPRRLLLPAMRPFSRAFWLVAWLGLGAVLLATLSRAREARGGAASEPPIAWWRQPAALLAPLLLLANGFSPYLGLKTEHSFAMFSNLRTEGDHWNHLLVPRSLRVFGYQDELVEIVSAEDPYLRKVRRGGYQLVPFELRRHVQQNPATALSYTQGAKKAVTRTASTKNDPYLAAPLHPVSKKLLLFRPVPPEGAGECAH